jgi:hypothetical protein
MHAIPKDLAFFLALGGLGLVFLLVLFKIATLASTQNVLGETFPEASDHAHSDD